MSKSDQLNSAFEIKYALDKSNRVVHVNQVERGLACNCHCIDCCQPLISRQGNIKAWHFAHASDSNCSGGSSETVLHARAKSLFLHHDWTKLGAVSHPKGDILLERFYIGSKFRCDVGTDRVFVEIIVHHDFEDEKLQYLKALRNVWVISYRLTDLIDLDITDIELIDILSKRCVVIRRPQWQWHSLPARTLSSMIWSRKQKCIWNLNPLELEGKTFAGMLRCSVAQDYNGTNKRDAVYEIHQIDGMYWWKTKDGLWWMVLSDKFAARLYMPTPLCQQNSPRAKLVLKDFRRPFSSTVSDARYIKELRSLSASRQVYDALYRISCMTNIELPSRNECYSNIKSLYHLAEDFIRRVLEPR